MNECDKLHHSSRRPEPLLPGLQQGAGAGGAAFAEALRRGRREPGGVQGRPEGLWRLGRELGPDDARDRLAPPPWTGPATSSSTGSKARAGSGPTAATRAGSRESASHARAQSSAGPSLWPPRRPSSPPSDAHASRRLDASSGHSSQAATASASSPSSSASSPFPGEPPGGPRICSAERSRAAEHRSGNVVKGKSRATRPSEAQAAHEAGVCPSASARCRCRHARHAPAAIGGPNPAWAHRNCGWKG